MSAYAIYVITQNPRFADDTDAGMAIAPSREGAVERLAEDIGLNLGWVTYEAACHFDEREDALAFLAAEWHGISVEDAREELKNERFRREFEYLLSI